MAFLINDKVNSEKWQYLLSVSKYSSPFQSRNYYDFIKSSEFYNSYCFALSINDNYKALVVVVIQKERGISSFFTKRAIVYGGPLIDNISNSELNTFINGVSSYLQKKAIYLEIRNFFDYSEYKEVFINAGWSYIPYLNFKLYLENLSKESLLRCFTSGRRREIKQSINEGAQSYLTNNEDEIKEFYEILVNLYRSRVKLPVPPLKYFTGLHEKSLALFFVVKHNSKIIGGAFCPVLFNKSIYTYYYCGLRDYHKKIFPTHLAVLAAMEFAIENHFSYIDFMGAGKPREKYGVREYKAQFGGELCEHGRWRMVLKPILFKIGEFGIRLIKLV